MKHLDIRAMLEDERKYCYALSLDTQKATGSIGYLRGDFGALGKDFYTTWNDYNESLKTDEFKSEFDELVNELRFENKGLLSGYEGIELIASAFVESRFKGAYTTEYGIRMDTDKYSYLFRCNPTKGDYNFYCYCYVKDKLNDHIEKTMSNNRFNKSKDKER